MVSCLCLRLVTLKSVRTFLPAVCHMSMRSPSSPWYGHHLGHGSFEASQHSASQWRNICCSQKIRSTTGNSDQNVSDESSRDFESTIEEIVNACKSGDKYGHQVSMSRQEVLERVKTVVERGYPREVLDKICQHPRVLENPQPLLELLKSLQDLGMSQKHLAAMITNDSTVLTYDKSSVLEAFYKLLKLGFTSDLIVKMFIKQPHVIRTDLDGVARRIEKLKLLFNTKHTFALLTNNPSLLFSDLEEIRRKFMYVYNEMGVAQPQMMHTEIFNKSLEHIHARHMFVLRAGFFRIVKEKEKFKNPKLDVILDTSDAAFAKKFGNMSAADYHCFKALLLKEELLYAGEQHGKVVDDVDDDDDEEEEEEGEESHDFEHEKYHHL